MTNRALAFLLSLLIASFALAKDEPHDTCLMFVTRNIAKGNGNFYMYVNIEQAEIKLSPGDSFEYDIFLAATNPTPVGGIDFDTDDANFRDTRTPDQSGIACHPGVDLAPAKGKWYHRKIDLSKFAGKHARNFKLVEEGDAPGLYVQFIDNIFITHANGTRDTIYENGPQPRNPRS